MRSGTWCRCSDRAQWVQNVRAATGKAILLSGDARMINCMKFPSPNVHQLKKSTWSARLSSRLNPSQVDCRGKPRPAVCQELALPTVWSLSRCLKIRKIGAILSRPGYRRTKSPARFAPVVVGPRGGIQRAIIALDSLSLRSSRLPHLRERPWQPRSILAASLESC
jgi:hypothetical protein